MGNKVKNKKLNKAIELVTSQDFPAFAAIMDVQYPDYDWEGITVTKDDGYELTLFHLWKEGLMDDSKGPVMFQHGAGNSAVSWLPKSSLSIEVIISTLAITEVCSTAKDM